MNSTNNYETCGLIHDYYPLQKMISIEKNGRIQYFYFGKRMFRIFMDAMAYKSVFVFFEYSDKTKILKGATAKEIVTLHKIMYTTHHGLKKIYCVDDIKARIEAQINRVEYKMFMDLELTMPKFGERAAFTPEIIQIGMVVTDENDTVINSYSTYVNPITPISNRAKLFLQITDDDFIDALPYEEFYKEYKRFIDIYKPTIYVWGGNDVKAFNDSYLIHNAKPIKARYVDLLKYIRQYYELKEDIGLFHALKIFDHVDASQAHHALTDATATKEVFVKFKQAINDEIFVDVKRELLTLDK